MNINEFWIQIGKGMKCNHCPAQDECDKTPIGIPCCDRIKSMYQQITKADGGHNLLPPDIRDFPWKFDCKGAVLCNDTQIGDFQGNMKLARFIANIHNKILKGR